MPMTISKETSIRSEKSIAKGDAYEKIDLYPVLLLSAFGRLQQPDSRYSAEEGVDYDVIVVGGDPEGVCAAVSSARNGLKTLLIEDDEALGGLMTLGKLNFIDICESRDGSILTQGLFMEFYNGCRRHRL